MAVEPAALTLRPLNIGEIFDRAITVYVRNFVVFTLIVLAALAPIGVAQALVVPDQTAQLRQAIDQIQHPTTATAPANPLAAYTPARAVALFAIVLVGLLLLPFVNNAVAVGVAAVYFGRRPDFAKCYGTVFSRWPRMLGVAAAFTAIFIAWYVAGLLVIGFSFVLLAVLAARVMLVAILLGVVGFVALIAFLISLMALVVVSAFAFYAVAIEDAGVGTAVSGAFSRLVNRREGGKLTLITLSFVAVEIGVSGMSATLGLLALFVLHSQALEVGISTIFNALLTAFVTVLLSVYYYDVRVRYEALDLEVSLSWLAAQGAAS
jgi:hypothetical protein